MRSSSLRAAGAGFVISSLCGTLLHFLYEWLGKPTAAAPFCAVNESVWEHMKLLFVPMLLFALGRSLLRRRAGTLSAQLAGICLGLLLIPVLFYTFNGAIVPSPAWFNIAVFFLASAAAYLTVAHRESKKASCNSRTADIVALLVLLLLSALFALFTFFPPRLGIFRDPLTGGYGVPLGG